MVKRFYSKDGKTRPITERKRKYRSLQSGSLFSGKVKSKKYAGIISITTPEEAGASARKMQQEFVHARSRKEKVHIMRSVDLAGKRAEAMAKRKKNPLGPFEWDRKIKVAQIYRNAAADMQFELDETR